MSYYLILSVLFILYIAFTQNKKKEMLPWVLFNLIAAGLSFTPLSMLPIWTYTQLAGFQFFIEQAVFFGFFGMVITYFSDKYDWDWSKYLKLLPFGIMCFVPCVYLFLANFGVSYTTVGYILSIIAIIPLQSAVEEVWFRHAWFNKGEDKFKTALMCVGNGIVFGFMHISEKIKFLIIAMFALTYIMPIKDKTSRLGVFYLLAVVAVVIAAQMGYVAPMLVWIHLGTQGIFGVVASIITAMTDGVETSSFYHCVWNCCVFLLQAEFFIGYDPLAAFSIPAVIALELVVGAIFIAITYVFCYKEKEGQTLYESKIEPMLPQWFQFDITGTKDWSLQNFLEGKFLSTSKVEV